MLNVSFQASIEGETAGFDINKVGFRHKEAMTNMKRKHTCNKECPGIATKGIFQDPGEDRVTIRDKGQPTVTGKPTWTGCCAATIGRTARSQLEAAACQSTG